MLISHILQSKATEGVFTIAPDKAVSDAATELSHRRIGSLVVSDDGHSPLGILSERDIVREVGRRGASCLSDKVADMMTTKLQTCLGTDTADSVLQRMTDGRFRHMPVVNDAGQMVGLITIGDAVKARLSELSMEKDALEGMIMGH